MVSGPGEGKQKKLMDFISRRCRAPESRKLENVNRGPEEIADCYRIRQNLLLGLDRLLISGIDCI